jgi:hypothetical protein
VKQEFTKRAKWCYGLSAVILLGGILLCVDGRHDKIGQLMGIAGISYAVSVASVNGHLATRKNHKD